MEMGGRLQAFFSRVVAISSTLATRDCSPPDPPRSPRSAPVKRLIFHTSACFFRSYLALPARQMRLEGLGF